MTERLYISLLSEIHSVHVNLLNHSLFLPRLYYDALIPDYLLVAMSLPLTFYLPLSPITLIPVLTFHICYFMLYIRDTYIPLPSRSKT